MIARYRRIGFAVSGLLHVGLGLVLLSSGATSVESQAADRVLPLTLAMFEAAPADDNNPPPQPVAVDPAPEVVSSAEANAESLTPEPEPEPEPEPSVPEAAPVQGPIAELPKPARVQPPRRPKPPPVARRVVNKVQSRPEVQARSTRPDRTVGAVPTQTASTPPRIVPDFVSAESDLADNANLRQRYLDKLVAEINRRKYYPRRSRRRGEEGTVVVRFEIGREGGLSNVAVARSSGIDRLDRAALKTLRKIARVDPIPDALGRERWPISVPIAFSLTR